MSTPRTVSRSLKRSAQQLAKVPDVGLREAVTDVVNEAAAVGGTFTRKRLPLIAEAKVSGGARSRTALVYGRPAGAWTIKTYGRDAVRITGKNKAGRPSGFPINGEFRRSARAAGPARRNWDNVVEYANDHVPSVIEDAVDEAIDDG